MRLWHAKFVMRLKNFRCRTVLAAAYEINISKHISKKKKSSAAHLVQAFFAGGVFYKSLITSFDVD